MAQADEHKLKGNAAYKAKDFDAAIGHYEAAIKVRAPGPGRGMMGCVEARHTRHGTRPKCTTRPPARRRCGESLGVSPAPTPPPPPRRQVLPGEPTYYNNLAAVLMEKKDFEGCIAMCRDVAET